LFQAIDFAPFGIFYHMSTNVMSFRSTVFAGVLSTLFAAVATWLFGFWPMLWNAVAIGSQKLWQVIVLPIPVPLGLFIPVAALAAMSVLRLWKKEEVRSTTSEPRYASKAMPTGSWRKQEIAEPAPLSTNEITMLRVLVNADGQELMLEDLAGRSRFSNLVAEQTAEHLLNRRYLTHRRDVIYGSMLRLSPAGRDFVLSAGY
jgi:hypothetical protein